MKVKKILEKPHRFDGEDIDIFWTSPNGVWQIINVEDIRLRGGHKCIGSTGIIYNTKTDYEEYYLYYYCLSGNHRWIGLYNSNIVIYNDGSISDEIKIESIPKYVKTAVKRLYTKAYQMFIMYRNLMCESFDDYKDGWEYKYNEPEKYKQMCAARDYFTGKDRENNKFIN